MSLPSLSIRRPVTTLMFYIGIVLLGVVAFRNLPVNFLPSIKIPKLTVQTSYQNVSPEEIENTVTQPIEAVLGTVTGARKVSSVSREGLSVITAEFYWGTNMNFAMLEVREKLDQLRSLLPREAGRPTILKVDPAVEPILTIAVSESSEENQFQNALSQSDGLSEGKSGNGATGQGETGEGTLMKSGRGAGERGGDGEEELQHLVELKETTRALIKRRIEQTEGVAQASVLGGLEREIVVEIDPKRTGALGITLEQVSNALTAANLSLPGGTIKSGLFRYSLRTVGEFSNAAEISSVVVHRTSSGRGVAIADLGSVHDGFKERVGITRYNGHEIIALNVRKEAGANTVEVSQRVHAVLEQLRKEYSSLQIDVISDQAEFIAKSITDVEQAIVIGALLAFFILFFFLRSARYPLIIGVTMPISILATFIAMYFFNIHLNVISLTGLALGIGMLGDNAIIVIENVTRLREQGKGIIESALEGAQEINLAVTASTLTNVAIFLPIIFVEGVAQQLFIDMGVTMTVSLLVSLLVAATLVPMLVSRDISLPEKRSTVSEIMHRGSERRFRSWVLLPFRFGFAFFFILFYGIVDLSKQGMSRVAPTFYASVEKVSGVTYAGIDRMLGWSLQNRGVVLAIILLLFVGAIGLASFIPAEPAPDIDQSRFVAQVHMPAGTTLEGTSSLVHRLEKDFGKVEGIKGVYASIGLPEEQTVQTAIDATLEKASLEIKVEDEANTQMVIEEVREYLDVIGQSYAGVEFSVKKRGTTFEQILRPEPNDIKVRVIGRDPLLAAQVANQFSKQLLQIDGLVDLRTSLQRGNPEYRFVVDRERAGQYGLSVHAVAQHIAQSIKGKEATYLNDFDRKITIRVRPAAGARTSVDELLASTLMTGGKSIPLRELVRWQQSDGQSEIWRENQQRVLVLVGNVTNRSIGSVVEDIQERIKAINLPAGYTISVGGENEEIQESFRSLFIVILLSLFLVYMILAAEYESILYPFVILLTSPLAFIGAITAMWITGQNYNVMSLIGLVIMIGAVDNDAVIAVDIITVLRREGMDLMGAIREGIRRRLRPILMTTATTVLGIIPLVFEFGTGSELVRALTIPLVGGLIASTVFTVFAIPTVYSFIDRWAIGRRTH